jgi:hypothetical protein
MAEALKLTSKRFLWTGTCRLHLAVGLFRGTPTIGDCCDEVAHGRELRVRFLLRNLTVATAFTPWIGLGFQFGDGSWGEDNCLVVDCT